MKRFRIILTISSIVLILASIWMMVLRTETSEAKLYPFEDAMLDLDEIFDLYHEEMNDAFNEKIEMLMAETGVTEIPEDGSCADNNVSTYCVAMKMTDMYLKFNSTLDKKRFMLGLEAGETEEAAAEAEEEAVHYQDVVLAEINLQRARIDRELENAKKALDLTLAAYHELRVAYPMHEEFMKTIDNLMEYRDKFSDIRREIETFPNKFIDATTTDCT